MTPAVMARPEGSPSCPPSSDVADARLLLFCRDDHDPFRFVVLALSICPPSYLLSVLSLFFRPKSDLPLELCLVCLSPGVAVGIIARRMGGGIHRTLRCLRLPHLPPKSPSPGEL